RIVDLDDVQGLATHHRLEGRILPVSGCGRAERADPAGGLQVAQDGQLIVDVAQVMNRDQVDLPGAQPGETLLDLRHALFPAVDTHLRGKKQAVANAKLLYQ